MRLHRALRSDGDGTPCTAVSEGLNIKAVRNLHRPTPLPMDETLGTPATVSVAAHRVARRCQAGTPSIGLDLSTNSVRLGK